MGCRVKPLFFNSHPMGGDVSEIPDGSPCWALTAKTAKGGADGVLVCYDMTHPCDVIRDCGDKTPTLESRMGTGGNQIPLVLCYDISHMGEPLRECGGGLSPTLLKEMGEGGQKVPLVLKTYKIDATASNAMNSSNPNSGIHEIDRAPCLDTTDPNPAKNQGGVMILMGQGGGQMSVTAGKTGTLRAQEHGHAPIILAGNTIGRKPENGGNGQGFAEGICYTLTAVDVPGVCIPIDTRDAIRKSAGKPIGVGKDGDPSYAISAQGKVPSVCIPLNMSPLTRVNSEGADGIGRPGEPSPCLGTTVGGFGVAYSVSENGRAELRLQKKVNSLMAGGGKPGQGYAAVLEGKTMAEETTARVRRLTPRECERLQGFPDDWTRIPYRGKPADKCPDAPRYKAIGNSWAVPVVRWIGRRIQHELEKEAE